MVSANDMDLNQNLEKNSVNSDDLTGVLGDKSYDDFSDDIKNCTDSFDIKNNYKFDESNNVERLKINQSNLVINGNNHIIDGSNKAIGFSFINEDVNITINDLTFVNCNQSVLFLSGKLTLNNVNFTNNFVNSLENFGGVVLLEKTGI